MLTYIILFIYIYINGSILIRASSRVLIELSQVDTSLHHLIIEFDFMFTRSSFNNRFEYESSLFESISSN
jgi:hypothetical protein